MSYMRGFQDHEVAGREKGGRDPRSREPHHLQRLWNSKREELFQKSDMNLKCR